MTDLDSWLAAIAGEKCEACGGSEADNTGKKWCKACHGEGRTWSIPLWQLCGPLSDWCEEQGDSVRAKLVRPAASRMLAFGSHPWPWRITVPSVEGVTDNWYWRWLPDSKGDEKHLPLREAARRLKLLWRKPCEKCGETGRMAKALYSSRAKEDWPKCETCSGCGYFSQQLVVGDGPVEVPADVAVCVCGKPLIVNVLGQSWSWECVCKRTNRTSPAASLDVEQWAANHLLRVPKEALT